MKTPDGIKWPRWVWLAPALTSLLCLLPLVLLWPRFQTLYWFGDDWDLISEMQRLGLTDWLALRYGENFAPVFFAFWEGAIALSRGSYMGMILVLWGTHLAILLLLAAILRRCDFPWEWQSLAVLTLGMPWSNIETLGWAACWVSMIPTLFFLLAWLLLLSPTPKSAVGSKWLVLAAMVSALASALSFSRGVFTGAVLAFFIICSSPAEGRFSPRNLWMAIGFALITVTCLLPYRWMLTDYSNLQGLNGRTLSSMISYGAHYVLLSPLFHLLPIPHKTVGLQALIVAGTCKVLIIATALRLSRGRQRSLLWTLLILDLIAAGLLGVGRYKLDIETAVSYRYQYVSLLCFAPFFAIFVARGLQLFKGPTVRNVAFAVVFTGWAGLLGYPWIRYMERWSRWRGTDVRNALASTPPDQRFGLPSITAGRARELIRIYNLR